MRSFRSIVLAAVSALAIPASVTVVAASIPQTAAAQSLPTIRVGQTLSGQFDGSEPLFNDQYPMRGYQMTLRRGEAVTVTASGRNLIVLPVILGPNDFTVLPEDGTPDRLTFTAPTDGVYSIAILATERANGSFTVGVQSAGRAAAAAPPPPPARPAPPPPTARPSPPPPPARTAPRASPPPAARPSPPAPAVRGQTTTTVTIAGVWTQADTRLDNGSALDIYRLTLKRGDRVTVRTESGGISHLAAVTGPNDFGQASEVAGQSTIEFTVQEPGEYSIGATPERGDVFGPYRIVVTVTGL